MEDLVFVDVEASGLHHDSYPIEVGWSYLDLTCASFLIRPAPEWGMEGWSPQSERIHGISREMLLKRGTDTWESARRLNSSLLGRTVFSDAPEFDRVWLTELYAVTGVEPTFDLGFRDAMRPIRAALVERGLDDRDLEDVERRVSVRWPRVHNAAADAQHLTALYRAAHEPDFLDRQGL